MSNAIVVYGLGFGDEGKGSIVDYLTRDVGAKLVVRFNGGAQAAHAVKLDDGREHVFAQFGSGTFAGALTVLSRHVVVNPKTALAEAAHLVQAGVENPLGRLIVEDDALITTPYHVMANRILESERGDGRHGSCGMGIGATVELARLGHFIQARDLTHGFNALAGKLMGLRADVKRLLLRGLAPNDHTRAMWNSFSDPFVVEHWVDQARDFGRQIVHVSDAAPLIRLALDESPVIFEGAQGVLLDEAHGFHPHTTWSDTTPRNALRLLELAGHTARPRVVGVTRTYTTRHGPGPFPTYTPEFDRLTEAHNGTGEWQGAFRRGVLDLALLDYAVRASHPTELALTHVDAIPDLPGRLCIGYENVRRPEPVYALTERAQLEAMEQLGHALSAARPSYMHVGAGDFRGAIQDALGLPITIESHGPTAADKRSVL